MTTFFNKVRGEGSQQEPEPVNLAQQIKDNNKQQHKVTKKTRQQIVDAIKVPEVVSDKPIVSNSQVNIMDSIESAYYGYAEAINDTHLEWFGNQSFIGYQSCAILSQHPLITIACNDPVDDALRKGWVLNKNDTEELKTLQLKKLNKLDKTMQIGKKLHDFARFGRCYGVRVAIFLVDNADPEYYELPFNPDAVTKNSYKGIIMPDPQWCIPLVTQKSLDPNSERFYKATYWQVGNMRYHWSHCVEYLHVDVPQILKPMYLYGGISLCQEIYQAVYNACISSNELPQLMQTVRQQVLHLDLDAVLANQALFEERMAAIVQYQNNYGIRMLDMPETLEYMQTSLSGMDNLSLFLYKLVASIARMPVAKFLKTDLSGGLSGKGAGEEAIYHETLQSIQAKMQPFLDRHYLLSSLSMFGKDLEIDAKFNQLDAMTTTEALAAEQAKQSIDAGYIASGVFDAAQVQKRVLADDESIYNGLGIVGVPKSVATSSNN